MILLDICELIVDCPHSTAKDEGHGFPLIRTPNIGKGRLILDNVHRVCKEVYDERNIRAIPQTNDIILAREAPAGNVALISKGQKVCLGQRTVLIRPNSNKVNPKFLVYYMLSPQIQHDLQCSANGATVAHINMPKIRNLKIQLPRKEVQDKIALILSRYDALIENYQKQIKLLEESAQRLYKEWFVDLRFPGHENTKIVDGVPEGWENKRIKDICSLITSGGTPSRNNKSFWENGNIKWIKTKELNDTWIIDTEEHITEAGLNSSSAKIFPPNTILMAIYASPTLGRLGILVHEACCNQAALGFVPNEFVSWQWLFYKLYELRNKFNSIARGAGQQNISAIVVKDTEIVIPDKNLIDKYTSFVTEIFNRQRTIIYEIKLLTEARDRLLPKLMNPKFLHINNI